MEQPVPYFAIFAGSGVLLSFVVGLLLGPLSKPYDTKYAFKLYTAGLIVGLLSEGLLFLGYKFAVLGVFLCFFLIAYLRTANLKQS